MKLEQRMYVLVHRSLSDKQKGIQLQHAVTKYQRKYNTVEYAQWADVDQTTIMLNGGSHDELIEHMDFLDELDVNHVHFDEPDLNYCTTAVCFLVDERMWDRKKYPDTLPDLTTEVSPGIFMTPSIHRIFDLEEYKTLIGGENNYKLKKFLEPFKLA